MREVDSEISSVEGSKTSKEEEIGKGGARAEVSVAA